MAELTFDSWISDGFVQACFEPILDLANFVRLCSSVTSPWIERPESIERYSITVIVEVVSLYDLPPYNLASAEVPKVSHVCMRREKIDVFLRCIYSPQVGNTVAIFLYRARDVVEERDVQGVCLPRDCIEEVTDVK
jgi:hypothetical protein